MIQNNISAPITSKNVQVIATQYYLLMLMQHFGTRSPGKLQKIIFENIHSDTALKWEWSSSSRRFYKNLRGTPIKGSRLINAIEPIVNGSKRIFQHPIWLILKNPEATLEEVHAYMKNLPATFQNKLFKTDKKSMASVRRVVNNKQDICRVSMIGNLDALACMLLIIREMELLHRVHPYIFAKWEAWNIANLLLLDEAFFQVSHNLYGIIQTLYIDKNQEFPPPFNSPFCSIIPEEYKSPTFKYGFIKPKDLCETITWYAHHHQLIDENDHDKKKFLYIALLKYDLIEIESQLKYLSSYRRINGHNCELPSPLRELTQDFNQDGRTPLIDAYLFD